MADPLEQYGSVFDEPGEDFRTYRPAAPTLAGDSVRPPQPPAPAEARSYTPTFRDRVRAALSLIPGFNPQTAESVATVAPYTPAAPIFEGGRLLGEAAENRSNTGALLGLGSIALGAAPLPLPAPARRLGPLAQYGRREPPPLTGHNIGSLQIPRVPRDVDPNLGLYSAADEAAHSYPRTAGTARDIQDWMASQGVTANEIAARGLTDLFRSPQQVITRQQLLTHLGENPIQLRSARYQGGPQYNIVRSSDDAVMAGPFPDEATARHELRAYAPSRLGRRGEHFHVDEVFDTPPGAAGPARYGPDQWPDLSLNAAGNPTYREDVLYAPPDLRAQARSGRSPLAFTDSHYPNEPNPIGWIRSSQQEAFERGPTGEADVARPVRGLLWDELQMPMAQRIRDQGARNEARIAELEARLPALRDEVTASRAAIMDFANRNNAALLPHRLHLPPQSVGDESLDRFLSGVHARPLPGVDTSVAAESVALKKRRRDALTAQDLATRELETARRGIAGNPFVNETDQALRTLMHYGLQNPALRDPNISGIFLTPGALQNERYDLSRAAQALRYNPDTRGLQYIPAGHTRHPTDDMARAHWFNMPGRQPVTPDQLPGIVGPDVARELLSRPRVAGEGGGWHLLPRLDNVELGGRGMRENYDRIYPETLDAILRRLDPAYPGRRLVNLNSQPHGYTGGSRAWYPEPVHFFPLTDRIRAQLARGLPYFAGAGAVATPALMGNEDPLQQYGGTP